MRTTSSALAASVFATLRQPSIAAAAIVDHVRTMSSRLVSRPDYPGLPG
jgi:hypothetical protein